MFDFDIPIAQNGDCFDRSVSSGRRDAAKPAHCRAMFK
ncbi:MAG: hypothetical protein WKG06_18085 [Segetibacter sp.]